METIIHTIKEGPISFKTPQPEGVNNKYELWEGIIGEETFPKTTGSAYYILSLRKTVEKSNEVDDVDKLLKDAGKSLAQVWQFASGSRMSLERVVVTRITNENLESNVNEVKETLLEKESLKQVASIGTVAFESCATYYHPPLKIAIELCLMARKNENLKKLFEYHYKTHVDSSEWYIHLYKIREVLVKNIFGNGKYVKSSLDISNNQWSDFGKILDNDDLRHAPKPVNYSQSVSFSEIEYAKKLGYIFVKSYLKHLGYDLNKNI